MLSELLNEDLPIWCVKIDLQINERALRDEAMASLCSSFLCAYISIMRSKQLIVLSLPGAELPSLKL